MSTRSKESCLDVFQINDIFCKLEFPPMCTLSKFWFSHIRPCLLICSYQSEHTMYFHTSGPRSRHVHSWKGLTPVSVVVFLVIQEAVQMPCCPPVVPPECELLPGCDVDVERLGRRRHWLVWSDTDQSDTDHQPTVWSHLLNISFSGCAFHWALQSRWSLKRFV